MPGIEQIKISLPSKILRVRSTSAGDLPDMVLGPLYTFTSRAWENYVKRRLSRTLPVPEVRFVKYT
jgi:hypothetical protein